MIFLLGIIPLVVADFVVCAVVSDVITTARTMVKRPVDNDAYHVAAAGITLKVLCLDPPDFAFFHSNTLKLAGGVRWQSSHCTGAVVVVVTDWYATSLLNGLLP